VSWLEIEGINGIYGVDICFYRAMQSYRLIRDQRCANAEEDIMETYFRYCHAGRIGSDGG
jgi:hypothetical protein